MDPKRRALGQHFLRDAGIARAIVDLVAPTSGDVVVEIGPGRGALTAELARRAGRVIALEVDRALAAELRDRKSTRLNSSHLVISYAVFCLKKKKKRSHHA